MNERPRLLDLFCGAGGAAMGYVRAGFEVVGVDIKPQPNYPFEFVQADALYLLGAAIDGTWQWNPDWLDQFDAIHASPPCQAFTQMSNRWRGAGGKTDEHVDLLTPTLTLLRTMDLPWVAENVPGAKSMMRPTLTLHGGMFGLGVHRPRLFESNVPLFAPEAIKTVNPIGVYGKAPDGRLLFKRVDGTEQRAARSLKEGGEAMGIDWMSWDELKEAIPPAYTEFIGVQLMQHLERDER